MSLSKKKTITDVELKDRRVIMRVDFNVVSAVTGKIDDEGRIVGAIPTIKMALAKGAKTVALLSHCGRPNGQRVEKFSLKPVMEPLERLLGKPCIFVPDCVGPVAEKAINEAPHGSVLLMENIRFHIEEEGKGVDAEGNKAVADPAKVEKFRDDLGKLGDILINDAFGTAHRAHSSVVGIDKERAAGLLMKKELEYFAKVLEAAHKPYCAIMGGAKVGDKIPVMKSMMKKGITDVVVGGGMAFTFLKQLHNTEIGASLYDAEGAEMIPSIMELAESYNVTIHLPVDFRCGDKFAKDAQCVVKTLAEGVPEGWMGLDIGPETEKIYHEVLSKSKTVVWNGPMGVFEFPNFAKGSISVLETLVEATKNGTTTVVGGGDSAALCTKFGHQADMSHISTGGGASMELLEGKVLPGVAALDEKWNSRFAWAWKSPSSRKTLPRTY